MHLAAVITYLKYKPAWLQLVIFGLITCATYIILGTLTEWAVNAFYGLNFQDTLQPDLKNPTVVASLRVKQALLTIAFFGVSALFFAYKSDRLPLRYLGVKPPQPAVFWLITLLALPAAMPFANWLNDFNHQLHLPGSMASTENAIRAFEKRAEELTKALLNMRGTGDLLLMLLVVGVIPAVCEELFFRSVLQRIFIQITRRPWIGIVITATLFSLFHGQMLGFLPRLFLGILLGALYWYSGSIWMAMLAHFLNNAVQVLIYHYRRDLADAENLMPPLLVIGSLLAVVAIFWYMRRISHTHYGELYDTDDDLVLPSSKDQ